MQNLSKHTISNHLFKDEQYKMQLLINYKIYHDKNIDTFIDLLTLICNVVWLMIRLTDITIVWNKSNAFTIKVMLIIKKYDLKIVFH